MENNLTTDMRLEVVCENQILMPQLSLQDVYTHIWLANPNNVCPLSCSSSSSRGLTLIVFMFFPFSFRLTP